MLMAGLATGWLVLGAGWCPTGPCYAVADGGEVEEWLLTVVLVGQMLRKPEIATR